MARKGFNFRSFTTFILTWAFLTLVVSGAVLYIAPPGRIANWTRWQLMILTKEHLKTNTPASAVTHQIGGGGGGGGQGFKTLAQLATEYGLSSETAIQNLAAKGLQAKAEDKMRDIANRSGRKPYEVVEILKGDPQK